MTTEPLEGHRWSIRKKKTSRSSLSWHAPSTASSTSSGENFRCQFKIKSWLSKRIKWVIRMSWDKYSMTRQNELLNRAIFRKRHFRASWPRFKHRIPWTLRWVFNSLCQPDPRHSMHRGCSRWREIPLLKSSLTWLTKESHRSEFASSKYHL